MLQYEINQKCSVKTCWELKYHKSKLLFKVFFFKLPHFVLKHHMTPKCGTTGKTAKTWNCKNHFYFLVYPAWILIFLQQLISWQDFQNSFKWLFVLEKILAWYTKISMIIFEQQYHASIIQYYVSCKPDCPKNFLQLILSYIFQQVKFLGFVS